jgi:hypothetical protein
MLRSAWSAVCKHNTGIRLWIAAGEGFNALLQAAVALVVVAAAVLLLLVLLLALLLLSMLIALVQRSSSISFDQSYISL